MLADGSVPGGWLLQVDPGSAVPVDSPGLSRRTWDSRQSRDTRRPEWAVSRWGAVEPAPTAGGLRQGGLAPGGGKVRIGAGVRARVKTMRCDTVTDGYLSADHWSQEPRESLSSHEPTADVNATACLLERCDIDGDSSRSCRYRWCR